MALSLKEQLISMNITLVLTQVNMLMDRKMDLELEYIMEIVTMENSWQIIIKDLEL